MNEMMTIQETSLASTLTGAVSSYTSLKADTSKDKKILFNVMNTPQFRLSDCINTTIKVTDVYCEMVDVVNEETGEMSNMPRVVLVDKDGNGYQAVSKGVFNALKKIFMVFGEPHWEGGIDLKIKQIKKGTYNILTLEVA